MRVFGTGPKACLIGSALLFSSPVLANQIDRQEPGHATASIVSTSRHVTERAPPSHAIAPRNAVSAARGRGRHAAGISCVPYARQLSGIMVIGNAWQWWDRASGTYARGDRPEVGSVLNFRSNGRMPLGHVAVVSRIVNAREVIVDHANWPGKAMRGNITKDVAVVDVSEANNWSAVRVALGYSGDFGSIYPTYGFIYNRPDPGIVTASIERPAPLPRINPVPSDLRPLAERGWRTFEEVAESPAGPARRMESRAASKPGD